MRTFLDEASPLGAGYGPDRAPMVAGLTEQGYCSGCHYRFDSVGMEESSGRSAQRAERRTSWAGGYRSVGA